MTDPTTIEQQNQSPDVPQTDPLYDEKVKLAESCVQTIKDNGGGLASLFLGKGKSVINYLVPKDGKGDDITSAFKENFLFKLLPFGQGEIKVGTETYASTADFLKDMKEKISKMETTAELDALKTNITNPSTQTPDQQTQSSQNQAPDITSSPVTPEVVIEGKNYMYPLSEKAKFSSGFGRRKHPITKLPNYHRGIDLSLAEGSKIFSMTDGKVVVNRKTALGGNEIHIKGSDGREYCYLHLKEKSPLVVGTEVVLGQEIGLVGHSGSATGPHLHFAIKEDKDFIDPIKLFPTIFDKDEITNADDIPQIMVNQQKQVTDNQQKQAT